jgi:hypothetical protein
MRVVYLFISGSFSGLSAVYVTSAVFLLPGHSTDATVNDQPSSAPERHAESVIAYFFRADLQELAVEQSPAYTGGRLKEAGKRLEMKEKNE